MLQVKVVSIRIPIDGIENAEGRLGKIFSGRHAVEDDGTMIRKGAQEIEHGDIARIDEKGMIPDIDDMSPCQRLDLGKVHNHAVGRIPVTPDDIARQGHLDRIAMPVQMPALAFVIGNTMTGIEFESAGNEHGKSRVEIGQELYHRRHSPFRRPAERLMLTTSDHCRDRTGMKYVYPVISRRAGGVSVGINLNPNNACNWACLYCQVPDLQRGGPPPIDLAQLKMELETLLEDILQGDFMEREVASDGRILCDIAFSGNGEPTTAAEFADAVDCVIDIMRRAGLPRSVKLRLITNGSQLHRPPVRQGIAAIGRFGLDATQEIEEGLGEIWFKVDRATASGIRTINRTARSPERLRNQLLQCAQLAPTWVQTCWFALDGRPPEKDEEQAYLELLDSVRTKIRGVHLYGLARPSLQAASDRLDRLDPERMQGLAERISALGIEVTLNP